MTKKVIETTNGWYMENEKEKVELDDIVGLVKTDEPTDSVQLKKEAQLSICEKRVIELEKENEQLKSDLDYFQRTYEIEERGLNIVAPMCTIGSPTPSRLELFKENEQLKQFKNKAFETIDSFIRGIRDEKGIDPENPTFQDGMEFALNWIITLKRDLENDFNKTENDNGDVE